MKEILRALALPFHPSKVEFRPGATTRDKKKALALAYADMRCYQERLDELFGLDWSVHYQPWGDNKVICELTLCLTNEDGSKRYVSRCSTGEAEAGDNSGTSAEAQAFKRACSAFGLGRYLYHFPTVWAGLDDSGKRFTDAEISRLRRAVVNHYQRNMANDVDLEEVEEVAI